MDHPSYHRPGTPYGDIYGAFGDNQVIYYSFSCMMHISIWFNAMASDILPYLFGKQFRFTLLCHAACEAPLVLPLGGFAYGQKCLFLANDWHAALVPLYVNKIF